MLMLEVRWIEKAEFLSKKLIYNKIIICIESRCMFKFGSNY